MRANSIGQSPLLMLDIIDILNKLKLPYAVIGAMAVSYYGVARSSLDADAVVFADVNEETIKKIRSAISKRKLTSIIKHGDAQDPLKGLVLIEDQYGNQVDLVLGIKGMDQDAAKRVVETEFQGFRINMIGAEDLVAMKIFAGSSKDLADAEGVLAVSRELIDRKKLIRLTKAYGNMAFETLNELLK